MENQLTQAQMNYVQVQAEVTGTLVALRFKLDTLLSWDGTKTGVGEEELVRLSTNPLMSFIIKGGTLSISRLDNAPTTLYVIGSQGGRAGLSGRESPGRASW